jgi:hypothetical protein
VLWAMAVLNMKLPQVNRGKGTLPWVCWERLFCGTYSQSCMVVFRCTLLCHLKLPRIVAVQGPHARFAEGEATGAPACLSQCMHTKASLHIYCAVPKLPLLWEVEGPHLFWNQ